MAAPITSTKQFPRDVINALNDLSANGERDFSTMGAGALASATTGWAQYADTTYTSGSPLAILADADISLPNNAGSVIDSQKPSDVSAFYDGTVITGRNGEHLVITMDLAAVPTSVNTTYMEIWFDIGGAVGELYRRIITFPRGNGVIRPLNFTVGVYTLDTWEQNGATVYIRANGTANVYNIRYVIARTHKAS